MRKPNLMVLIFLSLLLLPTDVGRTATQHEVGEAAAHLASKFLPQGALIEPLLEYNPATKTVTKPPAAKVGFLRNENARFLSFIYRMTQSPRGESQLFLRVVKDPDHRPVVLDEPLEGSYLYSESLQLLDLNGNGNNEIATITIQSTSIGSYIRIFQLRNDKLETIFHGDGYRFKFDSTLENGYRLVIYGKWSDASDSTIEVYSWSGRAFIRKDDEAFKYYALEFKRILSQIYSQRPLQASRRVTLTRQVAGIYLRLSRSSDAIRLCKDVLPMIDDPALTTIPDYKSSPLVNEKEQKRIQASWEIGRFQSKAALHRLLADAYRASGEAREAAKEGELARNLDEEAKNALSKIQH